MALRLFLILIIALPSWYFTDMDSSSNFFAVVLPIINFICVLLLGLWIIALFATIGKKQKPE